MSSPEGGYAGGNGDASGMGGTDTSVSSSPVDTNQGNQSSQASNNPAWDPVFNTVPPVFHDKIRPTFQQWDQNYQELQGKYQPWEQLNTPIEDVQKYLNVITQLNDNPMAFYQRLGTLLGITPEQAQQVAQNAGQGNANGQAPQPGQNGQVDDYENQFSDPEVVKLKAELDEYKQQSQSFQNFMQQQEHERAVAAYQQQADQEINRVKAAHEQTYPGIPFNENEVIRRVLLQTYQNPGKPVNVDAAYTEYMEMVNSIRAIPRPGAGAPNVVNPASGGGMPPGERINPATATPEQRKALVGQMLAQMRT